MDEKFSKLQDAHKKLFFMLMAVWKNVGIITRLLEHGNLPAAKKELQDLDKSLDDFFFNGE